MKRVLIALAVTLMVTPAFAGSTNKNVNTAVAGASNYNHSSINNSIKMNQKHQAPGMGGFGGGGPCPEGFQLSIPYGGIGIQSQCREGKQAIKANTLGTYFGDKSTRDYLCDSDESLYGLDHCVARRIKKSGVVQQRDRRNARR